MPDNSKPLPFHTSGQRQAGVLLHVSSLPGPHGIGDLGAAAHAWIDQLAAAHQAWWQILPLGPPAAGQSPYQCFSAFAGNPLLISLEALVIDGLLDGRDLKPLPGRLDRINFDRTARHKMRYLRRAWVAFCSGGGGRLRGAFDAFRQSAADWLDDYALFAALHAANEGQPFQNWSRDLVRREPDALAVMRDELAEAIDFESFLQFLFDRQLRALRRHARHRNIGILGDVPIFVSGDSADVWANPELFQLDRRRVPKAVAGVPPDDFCAQGQRWNNPLYDWDAMASQHYAWWIRRMRTSLAQCDAVRLDHFRGFDAYWRIPNDAPTATTGRWVTGPGAAFFDGLRAALGDLPLIAEDLGVITPRVTALRERFNLPSMKVLQFGFSDLTDSIHLPHRIDRHCVAYSGTHDNDTTVGWYRSLRPPERKRLARYAGDCSGTPEPAWTLIRLAWASAAALAIAPLQDVLSLPSTARMNKPGIGHGNWRWRISDPAAAQRGMRRLGEVTVTFARN